MFQIWSEVLFCVDPIIIFFLVFLCSIKSNFWTGNQEATPSGISNTVDEQKIANRETFALTDDCSLQSLMISTSVTSFPYINWLNSTQGCHQRASLFTPLLSFWYCMLKMKETPLPVHHCQLMKYPPLRYDQKSESLFPHSLPLEIQILNTYPCKVICWTRLWRLTSEILWNIQNIKSDVNEHLVKAIHTYTSYPSGIQITSVAVFCEHVI